MMEVKTAIEIDRTFQIRAYASPVSIPDSFGPLLPKKLDRRTAEILTTRVE
jgi:hypothetical protein